MSRLTQAQISEGWIEHVGEDCPVHPNSQPRVMFADGSIGGHQHAKYWHWGTTTAVGGRGIIAFLPDVTFPPPQRPLENPLQTQVAGDHYKDMKIQPIEYIHANGIGFCEGSVIKYVSRWRSKGGLDDLRKARHFLDLLIELERR